jgi:inner membrane protein
MPSRACPPPLPDDHGPARRRFWLIASALTIAAADTAFHAFSPSLVASGILDEAAHAATTIIILGALDWPGTRGFALAALVASLVIDLDHIPQYLGSHALTAGTPRPYPHSLPTLLAVALVAVVTRGRLRHLALGAELGLVGHFFRDMAEPSSKAGVALFWPASDVNVRLPYVLYGCVMVGLLIVALKRDRERRSRSSGRSSGPSGQTGQPGSKLVSGARDDHGSDQEVGEPAHRQLSADLGHS